MRNARYYALLAGCEKVKSPANRKAIDLIIDEACDNANYTIYTEKAAELDEWDGLFVRSIATLLACGDHNANVRKFFVARGINY